MSTSAPRLESLRQALQTALTPVSLAIADDSALHAGHAGAREGGHYRVTIVASAFTGRSRLERHRLVYDAVAAQLGNGVHALSIQAHAPEELS